MSTSNNKIAHRSIAILKLPHTVSALITYGQGVVRGMTGNAYFPSPIPTVAALQVAIDDLRAAETVALTRAKGAITLRNAKRAVLIGLLEQVRAYVQSIADANPENGPNVIDGSGLALRKALVRPSLGFRAKAGAVSGTVKVVAPAAARRASYEWEYSVDGGKTWLAMPPTLQARTVLAGLPALSAVQIRYRTVTRTGASDWSAPISFVVT